MASLPPARRRQLRTWIPTTGVGTQADRLCAVDGNGKGPALHDLASNDYLSLARHPLLREAASRAMSEQGVGAGGSRLVSGSRPIHQQLETDLGAWLGWDKVLLFPSGFQANLAAVSALANRHTLVLADRLIHHSLLVGVQASGARLRRFAHNDLDDLRRRLEHARETQKAQPVLVLTESLFSMEGTSPDLQGLVAICQRYGARLLVDEAHALGVLGEGGRGLTATLPAEARSGVTMVSGTFGKAFGSGGAFLATDAKQGDVLLQSSGAFRYTTALAPPLAAAALMALELLKQQPNWGSELVTQAEHWRDQIAAAGWSRPGGHGPILPLIVGEDQATLDLQQHLEEVGLLCIAIRPPTVAESSSRLRLVLHRHQGDDVLNLLVQGLNSAGTLGMNPQ
ncbi:MAG: aminotransferase class I/II-fold pyridoxal phosphate-dependent enzyme [Synechococcus sp.]|nr:aminotransferase class I/II-fold pyridoxal phosphate-dependent enzyme [Synechococcus sp.]